jgi:hypothetical protein
MGVHVLGDAIQALALLQRGDAAAVLDDLCKLNNDDGCF